MKFSGTSHSSALGKLADASQLVTVQAGGQLSLRHGDANGAEVNQMYAVVNADPSLVYRIDPNNLNEQTLVGELAFKSFGIALHPFNGKMYYVGVAADNGVYPVGVWDPQTNTNTVLPSGSNFRPNGKLSFHPDGILFGSEYSATRRLYTIDTETGEWTLFTVLDKYLKNGGDMVFTPDGQTLYSTGGVNPVLKRTDLGTGMVTNLGQVGPYTVSGLCFGRDGNLYYSDKTSGIGIIDVSTGYGSGLGTIYLGEVNDVAPVIAFTELSYADVSLTVLPGAISEDAEFSLSLETTELQGGVAVTFGPHGTIFNEPAVLNLEAHGVDFTDIEPEDVEIYYEDSETGQWELMEWEEIIVDVYAGTVQVINAKLPHFSRYAVAFSN